MKKIWLFPVLVPFFGIIVFIVWNLLQCLNLYLQAKDGIWYEDKLAKVLLMKTMPVQPDVVFVGSSRTMNHIDTAYLAAHGMSSFNLGLAGRGWHEYPSLVEAAANTAALAVVVSIGAKAPFRRVGCPTQLLIYDAITLGLNEELFNCGEMLFGDLFIDNLPMNRFKKFEAKRIKSMGLLEQNIDAIKQQYEYDLLSDDREINYIRGVGDRYVVIFSNGDGLVFSDRVRHSVFKPKFINLTHKKYNSQALDYMRFLAGIITAHGKTAVIIIEPSRWDERYMLNEEVLEKEVKAAHVISNAGLDYGQELWSDVGHLNYQGVRLYTKYLHGQLKELFHIEKTR